MSAHPFVVPLGLALRRLVAWRRRRRPLVVVASAPGRVERVMAMLDPDLDFEDFKFVADAASRQERTDAVVLLGLARELSADGAQLAMMRMAFLVGGDEWR